MVSPISALSGLALLAGAVQAQNYNSTVVVTATSEGATAVSTEVVTITSCTGSNVVSCHYVTSTPAPVPAVNSTSPAPAPAPARETTEAPPAPAPETTEAALETSAAPAPCAECTTIITVIEGVTVTVIGSSTVPPVSQPTGVSNETVAPVPVPESTEIAQSNGQSIIKAGLGSVAIGAIAALLM